MVVREAAPCKVLRIETRFMVAVRVASFCVTWACCLSPPASQAVFRVTSGRNDDCRIYGSTGHLKKAK